MADNRGPMSPSVGSIPWTWLRLITLVLIVMVVVPSPTLTLFAAVPPLPPERASVSSTGIEANNSSTQPSLSADGRFVAFASKASNLAPGDTNKKQDVFVHDRKTGETTRVSVSSTSTEGNGDSGAPSISADGRFVAFESKATNLVPTTSNKKQDVYVHDRQTGETTRVSISSAAVEGDGDSGAPSISADGRFVAFQSKATNLVPTTSNKKQDVYVHDRQTGQTTRVSISSAAVEGDGDSGAPSISADGRFVAFQSKATNLVPNTLNKKQGVYVHDRQTGQTTRVSVSTAGLESDGDSAAPSISADGRFVAFESKATSVVLGDTNKKLDVFVHDREGGETTRVSVSTAGLEGDGDSGAPSISADGRFVAFQSKATTLVLDDVNKKRDIFVHDRQTGETARLSDPNGVVEPDKNSEAPVISGDGNVVAFASLAANLVPGDTNNKEDVFVVQRNQVPVAVDDAGTTDQNTAVDFTVLTNDSDPDGDSLTVTGVTQGAHGAVTLAANTATYTAASGFVGDDSFTYAISDGRGGTATATVRITVRAVVVNQAPVVTAEAAEASITLPASAALTATVSDDGLPASPGTVTTTWSKFSGPGDVTFGDASALNTSASFSVDGSYVLRISAFDGQLTSTADVSITVSPSITGLPVDPATVAPPLDTTVASVLSRGTEFLYTGDNPIQTGVAPGTIDPVRAAVVRGKVLDRNAAALPGVTITILNHPEFGQTLSRADGMFDLAVNGGGPLTVNYAKAGLLAAQRQVDVRWQDFTIVPDVALIPLDPVVTSIDLTTSSMQVARGSTMTDSDGSRRATLLFPSGTTATMVMPDGSTQPVTTLHVRTTEYTVGPNGPKSMPAQLPVGTEYTYAANLSVEEALGAGASQVRFTPSIPFYLENFLGFPVGLAVPLGTYDPDRATWIPGDNGRVVKIIGVTGVLADLDTTGNGTPDQGASLGVTIAERQQLAQLYSVGQTLWRVPLAHFSSIDLNWPAVSRTPPDTPEGQTFWTNACNTRKARSIIDVEAQTSGEAVAVVGTPFFLRYSSERAPGRKAAYTLNIPLSSAVAEPRRRIDLGIDVAGRSFHQSVPWAPSLSTTFTWDGKDAYGRTVKGAAPATVTLTYIDDGGTYVVPTRFGAPGAGAPLGVPTRLEYSVSRTSRLSIGAFDAGSAGLGGWTLSEHHAYDPAGRILYQGDGTRRSAESVIGSTVSEVAAAGWCCSSDPSSTIGAIAVAADRTIYVAETVPGRVFAVSPTGSVSRIAGSGSFCGPNIGDGGPATAADLCGVKTVRIGPDGSLYILEVNSTIGSFGTRVRRVANGIIRTVAGGNGTYQDFEIGVNGDGGPATQARVGFTGSITIGPDGAIYIPETGTNHVRRVGPDGIITSIAGFGPRGFSGDGGAAMWAMLSSPVSVAVGRTGEIYIADQANERIRVVRPDGIINTIAGGGTNVCADSSCGDGPALQARISPGDLVLDSDGALYFFDANFGVVRRLSPEGIIVRVAGAGTCIDQPFGPPPDCGNGGPALRAPASLGSIALGPDGFLYFLQRFTFHPTTLRRISLVPLGFSASDVAIASDDGTRLYQFDETGRHLRTLDALTGGTLFTFQYDDAGRLSQIVDGKFNFTTIERDFSGNPTRIVAPFGQPTTLGVDGNGYLTVIANPAGEAFRFAYTADGLMTVSTTPGGFTKSFTYDALGLLTREEDAAGGSWSLTRTEPDTRSATIVETSALGVSTTYEVSRSPSGDITHVVTPPSGLPRSVTLAADGVNSTITPSGMVRTQTLGADPRFGMQSPLAAAITSSTPGGVTSTTTSAETVAQSNPLNPQQQTDTVHVDGRTYTRAYASNTFTMTSPAGRQTTTNFDNQDYVLGRRIGNLNAGSFSYDFGGHLMNATFGSGADTRGFAFAFDVAGYLSRITDPLSRTVDFAYDAAGRVTQKTLSDGNVISFAYDVDGNMTSVTPPGRPAHRFTSSLVGLLTSYTAPGASNETTYAYDLDRRLTSITYPSGQSMTLTYDGGARVGTLTIPEGPYTFDYDATTGKLARLTAPGGGRLSYSYDGSLPTRVSWSGEITGSLSRTVDSSFRTASERVNDANAVTFQYDGDSLLTAAGQLAISRHAQNGLVTGTTLGNVTDARAYNGFGEPTSYSATQNGNALFAATYAYDKLGRIVSKTEAIGGATPTTFNYAYDAAGRLREVKRDGAVVSTYTYDANGNRLSGPGLAAAPHYDDQDRLVDYGGAVYTHTANGARLTKASGGQTTEYDYDVLGNLRHVTRPDGRDIEYVIDGEQRRIGKKIDGTLAQGFLYEGSRIIAELGPDSGLVSRFVYGTRGNVPDYMVKGAATYRIITDHVGSPRLVVDASTGVVVQRMDFDEFGNVLADTNPGFQPFGFASGLYDRDTALTRFAARDYDSAVGRWTAKDPLLFAGGGANLYEYAMGNPVAMVDPDGTDLVGFHQDGAAHTYWGVGDEDSGWDVYDFIPDRAHLEDVPAIISAVANLDFSKSVPGEWYPRGHWTNKQLQERASSKHVWRVTHGSGKNARLRKAFEDARKNPGRFSAAHNCYTSGVCVAFPVLFDLHTSFGPQTNDALFEAISGAQIYGR